MARREPKRFQEFYTIAVEAGLSCPDGRAYYLINRVNNGDFPPHSGSAGERMAAAREETAQRWKAHFEAGNSLKSLSYGAAGRKPCRK